MFGRSIYSIMLEKFSSFAMDATHAEIMSLYSYLKERHTKSAKLMAIEELKVALLNDFKHEEELMCKHNMPLSDYLIHTESHEIMLEEFKKVTPDTVKEFFEVYLIEHINTLDKALNEFINTKKSKNNILKRLFK